jgi:protein involved in polysaccharide export with SLBB domain
MYSEHKSSGCELVVCFPAMTMQLGRMEVFARRLAALTCGLILFVSAGPGYAQSTTNSLVSTTAMTSITRALVPLRGDLDDKHVIRPGDKLTFRVDEDKEEAKQLVVTDSGEVELPSTLGRFTAAAKTCKALAQEIKVALEKDYYHRATVHLGIDTVNPVRGKAYIAGQVTKPGPLTLPTDEPLTVYQAVLLAQPTQWAKLSEVRLTRGVGRNAQIRTVNVEAIQKGKRELDLPLEPDDLVFVEERGIKFGN